MTDPAFAVRPRLAWASVILTFALASALWVEVRGHAARTAFQAPPDFGAARWAAVADAGEAVRVWGEAGLHGRKLLVLSGRWANVKSSDLEPADGAAGASGTEGDLIDANTALLASMRSAISREIQVVMPPEAFRRRLADVAGAKELTAGDGWFTLPFHGFARRFSVPERLAAPGESVLALVEPSFFAGGAPAAPLEWLRERGVDVELGLVALADPTATPEQRERAAAFAQRSGAVAVEVRR